MKKIVRARAPFAVLLGAIVALTLACSADFAPSAPKSPQISVPSEPSNNLLGLLGANDGDSDRDSDGLLQGLLSNLSLYRCDSPDLGSVSKTIGPAGGVVQIGPHSLTVPAGALYKPVTITATARSGKYVKIDFEPHGLRFKTRATLRLSYSHCGSRPLLPKVVYVDGVGDLLSVLELVPALNDRSNDRVTAWLRHFSGYAIAD
jgi:hypothetical protein